jgi:hypothetical protein
MKTLFLILTLTIGSKSIDKATPTFDRSQAVNPLIGDISYEKKFGCKPNSLTDNFLRIQTHLEYVEGILRKKDVSHLSVTLQKKRTNILNKLHQYWTKGIFPKNYDYPNQRKPCFIDKDENICAVGYLIEQTTSRQVAESINENYKYDYLLDMDDAVIDQWIVSNGLTKQECAMIQPTYGGPTPTNSYDNVSPAYGISSSVISGLNVSLITMNGIQIGKGYKSPAFPIIGLVSGAGQIILGAAMWPTDHYDSWTGITYSNNTQKTLCMTNIGIGTSTMILSTINLIINKKRPNATTQWNIYSYPTYNNEVGIGFSFSRRF